MKRLNNLITETNITVEFCKAAILEAAKGKRKRYAVRKTLAKIDKRAIEIRDIVLSSDKDPHFYRWGTNVTSNIN